MKRYSISIVAAIALVIFASYGAFAQTSGGTAGTPTATSQPSTAALTKLANEFGVSLDSLSALSAQGYKAGEIWLALELSKTSGKSLSDVVALAAGKNGHGWGEVAQALGIDPNSKDFQSMVKEMAKEQGDLEKAGQDGKDSATAEADHPEGQSAGTDAESSGHPEASKGHGDADKGGSGEKD